MGNRRGIAVYYCCFLRPLLPLILPYSYSILLIIVIMTDALQVINTTKIAVVLVSCIKNGRKGSSSRAPLLLMITVDLMTTTTTDNNYTFTGQNIDSDMLILLSKPKRCFCSTPLLLLFLSLLTTDWNSRTCGSSSTVNIRSLLLLSSFLRSSCCCCYYYDDNSNDVSGSLILHSYELQRLCMIVIH